MSQATDGGNATHAKNAVINTSPKILEKEFYSWADIENLVANLAQDILNADKKYDCILGITNGGIIPARLVARNLGVNNIQFIPVRNKSVILSEVPKLSTEGSQKYLVVDDIYDTGDTYRKVAQITMGSDCDFAFCMSRFEQKIGFSPKVLNHDRWIVFPWELS